MVEPETSLFSPDRLYKTTDFSAIDSSETDKQLRADVKTMGTILGNIIKEYEGEEIFNKVETLRQHAKVIEIHSIISLYNNSVRSLNLRFYKT